jgi:hypothetical protein
MEAGLEAQHAQLDARLRHLQREETRLAAQAGILAARLGARLGTQANPAAAAWRPLHRCFAFVDPQHARQYAVALQLLGGGTLGVVVADSLDAAGQLLAAQSGGGNAQGGPRTSERPQRIWPLDGLHASDRTAQQRAAALKFPPGGLQWDVS